MTVLIGRRELFAFAERYSSCRLKDYTDLTDGVVLCALFNLVFPDLCIRTASPQTHTTSQRTQMNWAALEAALDAVGIPQSLLDREALMRGDTEKGFSTLVLFYFLFHLTKRTDFSAEFATDVSSDLTEFLQSIDSIAALVKGGALPLSAVPPQLQEQLRAVTTLPRQRKTPKMERKKKKRSIARRKQRSLSLSVSSLESSILEEGKDLEKELSFDSGTTLVERHLSADTETVVGRLSEENTITESCGLHSACFTKNAHHKNSCSVIKNNKSSSRDIAEEGGTQREVDLQTALIVKSEECEELKKKNVQLLSQLSHYHLDASSSVSCLPVEKKGIYDREHEEENCENWKKRLTLAEDELMHLRRILQNTRCERQRKLPLENDEGTLSEELLEDIIDAETGEVIKVHETATLLNGVLLDTLRNSPQRREEAQKWLWHIISAYHVIETRLVTACDVAVMRWQQLRTKRENSDDKEGNEASHDDDSSVSGDNNNDGNNTVREYAVEFPSTPGTTAKAMQPSMEMALPSLVPDAATPTFHSKMMMIETETERRRRQFEQQLAQLHTIEMKLRHRVQVREDQLRSLAQKAVERDNKWKSLCGAIHEAERASFGIAEAETAEEVEKLLAQRNSWYARADKESVGLMEDSQHGSVDEAQDGTDDVARSHDVCEAMQTLVQSVTQDRDRLQKEVLLLRKEAQKAAEMRLHHQQHCHKKKGQKEVERLEEEIHSRLVLQKEYEDDEIWFVRANAHHPFTLSSPSTKQTPSPPQPTKPLGNRDAVAQLGRNLSALLSSAVPSR